MRWLHLRLEAPMAAFGGVVVGVQGVIRNQPAQSMCAGLFANALGWRRRERTRHQALQDRLIVGVVWEAPPSTGRMTDYQTAQLDKTDRAWTTRGTPDERDGQAATYDAPEQRWRDYHGDLRLDAVIRLEPADDEPTIKDVALAIQHPARPLFIGRKPCMPSRPMFDGWIDGASARDALIAVVPAGKSGRLAYWPEREGVADAHRITTVSDERDWASGLHGGERHVCEGLIVAAEGEA